MYTYPFFHFFCLIISLAYHTHYGMVIKRSADERKAIKVQYSSWNRSMFPELTFWEIRVCQEKFVHIKCALNLFLYCIKFWDQYTNTLKRYSHFPESGGSHIFPDFAQCVYFTLKIYAQALHHYLYTGIFCDLATWHKGPRSWCLIDNCLIYIFYYWVFVEYEDMSSILYMMSVFILEIY